MSWTLSITGKGGVGKTTLAAMAVRWLAGSGRKPILAVDADPNVCLDALLGLHAVSTVGGVREEVRETSGSTSAAAMGKVELLNLKIQESLVEAGDFDLIAMGRPEGPGCYCYANNVLRNVLSQLAADYPYVVIDNEAGLENLSRRTVQESDWLVFVSDPSARGLTTARRLHDLAIELKIPARFFGLVVNRLRDDSTLKAAAQVLRGTEVVLLGGIPEDEEVARRDSQALPVFGLSNENRAFSAARDLFDSMKQCQNALSGASF